MKLNENAVVIGNKIVLVPYKKHHVIKYHSWMQQQDLQELTASEPLSLKEEFHMQNTWHQDEKKLTFIIMDKEKWKACTSNTTTGFRVEVATFHNDSDADSKSLDLEIDCMVGDINLFCLGDSWSCGAEISLMIAEKKYRRKGYGSEAIKLMMSYGMKNLHVQAFTAKIGLDNKPSLKLFLNKLCFIKTDESQVFNEATLQYLVNSRGLCIIPNLINKKIEYVYL